VLALWRGAVKKKNEIIQEGYDFEVLYNWDCLQRIVRHPKYKKLCEYLEFDNAGFALRELRRNPNSLIESGHHSWQRLEKAENERIAGQERLLEHIRSRFGLVAPVQTEIILSKKYAPSFFSNIPMFNKNPFAVSFISSRTKEDKNGEILLNPIHQGHFLVLKIDAAAHFKSQIVSGVKELIDAYRGMIARKYKIVKPCRRLRQRLRGSNGEMSMTFKIDLLADEKDVLRELRKAIGLTPTQNRYHLEKRINYYEIWDKRADWVSFSEIANEYDINLSAAKKRFQRAFDLIFNRKYHHDLWWKLFSPDPKKRNQPFLIFSSQIKPLTSENDGDNDSGFIEERVPESFSAYDANAVLLWLDIQKHCSKCREECKPPLAQEDIKEWRPCPKLAEDLTEDMSPKSRQFYLEKSRQT
jgi:hypothetical protein